MKLDRHKQKSNGRQIWFLKDLLIMKHPQALLRQEQSISLLPPDDDRHYVNDNDNLLLGEKNRE